MAGKEKLLPLFIFLGCAVLIAGIMAWNLRPQEAEELPHWEEREELPTQSAAEPTEQSLEEPRIEKPVLRLPSQDWGAPNPYLHYSRGPGIYKMQLIFDSLLERTESGYIPWLASSYEVKDDGRTIVFSLRSGVKWHDGRDLTPEDVLFSMEYALKYPPVLAHISPGEVTFRLEGDRLIAELTTPDSTMLGKLGSVRIIPKHVYAEVTDPYTFSEPAAFIGTGPFKLDSYDKEHGTYRFVENPAFFGPAPRVSAIEFVPVADETLALLQGAVDAATVSPDALGLFIANSNFGIRQNPGFWGYRLLFNLNVEPLGNLQFRQALAYTIDREQLVELITRGAGIPGSFGLLPRDHVNYYPQVRDYPHSVELAEQLIAEGELVIPPLTLLVAGDREVRIGQVLKQQLEKIGVELVVRSVDARTKDTLVQEGNYQLALLGHGGMGMDPDYLRLRFAWEGPSQLVSQFTSAGFHHPKIKELALLQREATDPAVRQELLNQLQELLAENVPEILLFCTTDFFVYNRAKLDSWVYMFDHHEPSHSKLSYLMQEDSAQTNE